MDSINEKKLLLLTEKHVYTLFEQTKTKPQEKLQFKLNKQMDIFSISLPKKLSDEING